MTVLPVETPDQREAFIRLPWQLYRDDPNWVPPLLRDMRRMLDPEVHPFHRHSEVRLFLALRDGRPAGRIAAIHNRNHVAFHDEPVGFFGFFETVRDPAVAGPLLDAAAHWLAARGLRTIRGPASFSTNEQVGLLVEGFEGPPVILMPYNPPWYEELLRAAGFREAKTLVAYFSDDNTPPEYLVRASRMVRDRYGVRVRGLRMDEFDEDLARIRRIYNSAWEKNWGFVPMTDAEIRHMAEELRPVVNPDLTLIAESEAGEPIGFALALPDLNIALAAADGRLFPFGLLKIFRRRRDIHRLRVLTLGLVEAYRGKAIDALLYHEIFRRGAANGITEGEFSWILEDNRRMRDALERFGSRLYRRYRLYDRTIG